MTIGQRYSLRTAIGHGGMGTVWRAADTLLRRDVAIKEVILPPGLAPSDRDAMFERTLREARAAAALQHPAVVQVYDVVTEAGRPWIVMELLDARSLADAVIEDGPLAQRAVAKIGIALLGALEVAHAIGVLHRDVKPANVLICTDGRCVLTDFGVARIPTEVQLTTPGMVLGSPHFISPERAMGQDFGPPSDLFSLGVTLYTAVEGRPPFDKGDPIETMHSVVQDPPAPMRRAGVLAEVLTGLLEKDPSHRIDVHTARRMLRDLLAGPLASRAPAHMMTDPYSVIPTQRSPWQPPTPSAPPPPPEPQPTGQIGGRAMIKPGESLTDRLAAVRQANRKSSATQFAAAEATGTNPGTPPPMPDTAASPMVAGPATGPMPEINPPTNPHRPMIDLGVARTPGSAARDRASSADVPTGAWPAPDGAAPRWTEPTRPTSATSAPTTSGDSGPGSAARAGAALDQAISGVRRSTTEVISTVKKWPLKIQIAVAGGLAMVLLLGLVLMISGGDDPTNPNPPQTVANNPPAGPDFEVETHAARGLSVNVPKGWKKTGAGVWIDFTDPTANGRKVRILVENASAEPLRFLEIAANGLKKNKTSCPSPFSQVTLQEIQVGDKAGAELEYTCGSGAEMRHGVWAAVVEDGKAYSFYLTTNDEQFEESRKFFDEMVTSFQLTAAN